VAAGFGLAWLLVGPVAGAAAQFAVEAFACVAVVRQAAGEAAAAGAAARLAVA
jgi:hypothetical protein